MKAVKNTNNSLNVTEHTFQLELSFVEMNIIKKSLKLFAGDLTCQQTESNIAKKILKELP